VTITPSLGQTIMTSRHPSVDHFGDQRPRWVRQTASPSGSWHKRAGYGDPAVAGRRTVRMGYLSACSGILTPVHDNAFAQLAAPAFWGFLLAPVSGGQHQPFIQDVCVMCAEQIGNFLKTPMAETLRRTAFRSRSLLLFNFDIADDKICPRRVFSSR